MAQAVGRNTDLDCRVREGPCGSVITLVGLGKRLLVELLDGPPDKRRSRGQGCGSKEQE